MLVRGVMLVCVFFLGGGLVAPFVCTYVQVVPKRTGEIGVVELGDAQHLAALAPALLLELLVPVRLIKCGWVGNVVRRDEPSRPLPLRHRPTPTKNPTNPGQCVT